MKLWHIVRDGAADWDEYSDAVVAAETEAKARGTHPDGRTELIEPLDAWDRTWVAPEKVSVEYIGKAKRGMKAGVICASFHAG